MIYSVAKALIQYNKAVGLVVTAHYTTKAMGGTTKINRIGDFDVIDAKHHNATIYFLLQECHTHNQPIIVEYREITHIDGMCPERFVIANYIPVDGISKALNINTRAGRPPKKKD